ncbi:MAG: polysaccharide biosynthesis tyrosine autokinase [Candidatus Omnitrophota bacterium]
MEQGYDLNLRDFWGILLKRKAEIFVSLIAIFAVVVIYTNIQTPVYQAQSLIRIDSSTQLSKIIFPGSGAYGFSWRDLEYERSAYSKQIISIPIVEKAATELGLLNPKLTQKEKDQIIGEIQSNISAAEIQQTYMIRLYANFEDPQKAADIANKITDVFIRANAERKSEQARNVRIFIENALQDVSSKMKIQEERARALTTQGVVGSGVDIVQRITEAEKKLSELSVKYTDSYPSIIALKEDIVRLKAQLRGLPQEEFEYGILKRDLAVNEALYSSLQQQLQEAQIKEAEKINDLVVVNPALVPKKPFYPNKPRNYMIGIVLGIIFGMGLAFIIEHLDTSIGRVDDIENFIKVNVLGIIPYYNFRRKGESKRGSGKRKFWFKFKKRDDEDTQVKSVLEIEKSEDSSLFFEALRILGVNLQMIFGNEGSKIKNKIIMITSCKPDEGKSTIASALSIVLAQMGHRVLVLDTDVRRAHLHTNFGIMDKKSGFTDILTEKVSVQEAVKTATDIMLGSVNVDKLFDNPWINNINIITAGSTSSNVINLFNSEKLDKLLNYCKNNYDVVLVDTSPILAVSEPSILLNKVEGVLLVYRVGFASRIALRRAKIQIENIRGIGSLSGVVLNNVTPEISMTDSYYYQRKYYKLEDRKVNNPQKDIAEGKNV